MADPTDTINLQLTPTDYASAASLAWARKTNRNMSLGMSDAATKVVAEWGNRVDNVERRIQAVLSGLVHNVRAYGAIGDNVADDTAAIQAAIDAANTYGGRVYLPAGDYRVTSSLVFYTHTAIEGSGTSDANLRYSGTGYCIDTSSPGTRTYYPVFTRFAIFYTAASAGGIHLQDASLAVVRDVRIAGPVSPLTGDGVRMTGNTNGNAVYNTIDHCIVLFAVNGYLIGATGSNEAYLHNTRAGGCTRGVYIQASNRAMIDKCALEGNTTAVELDSDSTAAMDGVVVTNTRFEGNTNNIVVGGATPANVRGLLTGFNRHFTGLAYNAACYSTTRPMLHPDTGGAGSGGERLFFSSAETANPAYEFRTAGSAAPTGRIINTNTTSGTPNTLEVGGGRLLGNALSIGTWASPVFTQTASWRNDGRIAATGIDLTGTFASTSNASFTSATATITIGDGVTAGNPQHVYQSAAANTHTFTVFRKGTAASGNRGGWNFNANNDLTYLTYDPSGNLHSIFPFIIDYDGTNGRTVCRINRLALNLGTALAYPTHITLSAEWGDAATATVDYGSINNAQITITPGGSGIGANPTVTVADPNGGWTTPATIAMRNGGADTGITGFTIADTTTDFTVSMTGTPNGTYIIRWFRIGRT